MRRESFYRSLIKCFKLHPIHCRMLIVEGTCRPTYFGAPTDTLGLYSFAFWEEITPLVCLPVVTLLCNLRLEDYHLMASLDRINDFLVADTSLSRDVR